MENNSLLYNKNHILPCSQEKEKLNFKQSQIKNS